MAKSILVFLTALGLGAGASILLMVQTSHDRTGGNSLPTLARPTLARLTLVSQFTSTPKTLRSVGPRETLSFVENCTQTRCRCASYVVTEIVATPAIVSASKAFDVGPRPSAKCPASGGYAHGIPVTGQKGRCYACPSGMTYSAILRDGGNIRRRWGGRDVCVASTRKCQ